VTCFAPKEVNQLAWTQNWAILSRSYHSGFSPIHRGRDSARYRVEQSQSLWAPKQQLYLVCTEFGTVSVVSITVWRQIIIIVACWEHIVLVAVVLLLDLPNKCWPSWAVTSHADRPLTMSVNCLGNFMAHYGLVYASRCSDAPILPARAYISRCWYDAIFDVK